jgi:cobalamin biosynthesis protein CobT
MLDENYALSERADSLKIALEYLESKNRRLSKKVAKYKRMYKNAKKSKTTISKNIGAVIDLVSDDEDDVVVVKEEVVVVEKPVPVVEKPAHTKPDPVVEKPAPTKPSPVVEPIVMTIEEAAEEEEVVEEEVVEEEVVEEEVVEEEVVEEEVVEEEEEAEEEEEEEEEEEAAAEEVVDDQEEEEAAEVVDDQEEEEAEEDAAEEEEEEEAEVYETVIKGKTYYIQNEKDGPIYEADENGEISLEVGVYKNGKPTFF